ncbi:nitrite reductase large subunit NirB [Allokutzneria oryzae]|uniref:assimilatory sulfite reductase (ferredoxin) n=1 Tax=Allokutzneria oryzae TaxID=1378989 RepID=A0ABV6A8M1_9PSEU
MKHLVVIGHGMVGHRLVQALRARDTAGEWRITVLAEEARPAYDRVALSSYVDDWDAARLQLDGAGFAGDPHVDLRLGAPVVEIEREARVVRTVTGHVLGYDALVLATGSSPFVPPVPGHDLPGCFTYRTIEDLDAIRSAAKGHTTGVVVGGGLLGLEAANVLRGLGLGGHVIELAPRLMPLQVDEGGGALLRRTVEDMGLEVHCGVSVSEVRRHGDGLLVNLSDGGNVHTGLVVFSAGVRPRDELFRTAGLDVAERGGAVVDDTCRTSDPDVWAVGECASFDGRAYGLVAPGYAMAETVADRLLGGDATFSTPDTSTKLKLLGVDVASFGDAHATTAGALEVVHNDPVTGVYKKLVVSDDATTLLGGVLVGDASAYGSLRPLVGRALPADPGSLIGPPGGAPALGLDALPADAQVCSCHAVTKVTVEKAVHDGCHDVPALKTCTKAGTGCGSCVPMLKQLLVSCGVEQSKALCEHFDHSRAELFEILRATGIRTFSALLARHGRGRGCDICKPTVASILASLGSGHVLDGEQAALQDTNDHFLANLQRNGTYSVVPRIPGGEITPEKLLVIAEVARDFALYTKITGGQRIDLFGATVDQLPQIWRRLVDAGFESGHAYGKALRTVKSCVGEAWCRYGVQDSVGLAIELELRYRGLRAPHKIKAAVSGCARECAEARSKDIGVIATENGWNLYVGGNGGFTPRHADLLVSDVDKRSLLALIDRFLMFYVRTADRLQRTSAWVEAMDGGLDHLREVIVEDSLGICAELELAMAAHVDSYADEWRGVLEDPVKLARFTSFVNAPGTPDPTISFRAERGQKVPVPLGVPEVRR